MKKDLTRSIAGRLDIPPEILSSVPVGTFRGKGELSMENHKGILAYSHDAIRIAVARGAVVVRGRELTIAAMGKDRLVIKGVISLIELE